MAASNPWDRPSKLPRGDTNEDAIYLAVGRALSNWESVENEFIELFALFIGCENIHLSWTEFFPALRAYGAQVSFNSRVDMVEAAGSAYFFMLKEKEKKRQAENEFPNILKKCRSFVTLRNDIAHGMAQISIEIDPSSGHEKYLGFYLFPGLFASKKYRLGQPPAYAYTAAQLETIA